MKYDFHELGLSIKRCRQKKKEMRYLCKGCVHYKMSVFRKKCIFDFRNLSNDPYERDLVYSTCTDFELKKLRMI